MENSPNAKSVSAGEPKPNPNINNNNNSNNGDLLENPNSDRSDEQQLQDPVDGSSETTQSSQPARSSRTPFTNLSQVDADLALARTLQEQERAYMMLRMNNDGSDYGSWEAGSFIPDDEDDFNDFHDGTDVDEDEDGTDAGNDEYVFDVHENLNNSEEGNNPSIEFDPAIYSSDEAYARALQDAEDREMAARMLALAGIHDNDEDDDDDENEDDEDDDDDDSEHGDHGVNSQDAWEEVDPDELSYEELIALGEVVGTESRGLSANAISSLPSVNYKTGGTQNGSNDSCVICRLDYEDGETLTLLSCKHSYHPECINNWLNINKVCPVCSTEVSTSGNS